MKKLTKCCSLEIGADDYLVKPFVARELPARIRAALRRNAASARKTLSFGQVEVDIKRCVIRRRGRELKLTPAKCNVLTCFLRNPALTLGTILNSVWGYEYFSSTRTVDADVVKLRQQWEPEPECTRHFLTVHGVGYRFNANE